MAAIRRSIPGLETVGCQIFRTLGAGSDPGTKLPQLLQCGRSALGDYNQTSLNKPELNIPHWTSRTYQTSLWGAPPNHNCSPLASRGILWQCHCSSIPGSKPRWYRKSWGTYGKIWFKYSNHHSIIVLEYVPLNILEHDDCQCPCFPLMISCIFPMKLSSFDDCDDCNSGTSSFDGKLWKIYGPMDISPHDDHAAVDKHWVLIVKH